MKALNKFPAGAARNADFITGRSKPGRVIDCQRDLEDMPPSGSLCLHEETVAMMVAKLGWKLEDDDALGIALMEIEQLTAELEQVKTVVEMMRQVGFVEADTKVDA